MPDRQKPPWRSQRAFADRSRLRRILGNLYHLNAEEEPEQDDYPKGNEKFKAMFGPRGVLECTASDKDDPTEDRRFGKDRQADDQGYRPSDPEAHDDGRRGISCALENFMDRDARPENHFSLAQLNPDAYLDPPIKRVGRQNRPRARFRRHARNRLCRRRDCLKKLDDLGIADNTIVIFTTDNGAEKFTWPDGGTSPFRGEKASAGRAGSGCPSVIRWPGNIKPGRVSTG